MTSQCKWPIGYLKGKGKGKSGACECDGCAR